MVALRQRKRLLAGVCFFAFGAGFSWAQAQINAPVAEPIAKLNADPNVKPAAVESPPPAKPDSGSQIQKGKISYYSTKFNGRKTANGEIFDSNRLTMAHRTLPFGTLVEVTHTKSKRSVIVKVNDRGPAIASRIGDLSPAAAVKLGIVHAGLAHVTLKVVGGTSSDIGASIDTNKSAGRTKK